MGHRSCSRLRWRLRCFRGESRGYPIGVRLLLCFPKRGFLRCPDCGHLRGLFSGSLFCGLRGGLFGGLFRGALLCGLLRGLPGGLLLCLAARPVPRHAARRLFGLCLQRSPLRGQLLGGLFRGQPGGL